MNLISLSDKKTIFVLILVVCVFIASGCRKNVEHEVSGDSEYSGDQTLDTLYTDGKYALLDAGYSRVAANFFVHEYTSESIQATLDKAAASGGGTVFVPSGEYSITSVLKVPANVRLAGVFSSPSSRNQGPVTVFSVSDTSSVLNAPLITLCDGASLTGITVFYNDQDPSSVKEYPYTVSCESGKSFTIKDICLENSYSGISVSSPSAENVTISNVYMTAFHSGVRIEYCSEKLTMTDISVNPVYCKNVYPSSSFTSGDLDLYLRENLVGIYVAATGDVYCTSAEINTSKYGLEVNIPFIASCTPFFTGIESVSSLQPLRIDTVSMYGASFCNCVFSPAASSSSYGAYLSAAFTSVIVFNSCRFQGLPVSCIKSDGRGRLSFENCDFVGWKEFALDSGDRFISSVGSDFLASGDLGSFGESTVGLIGLGYTGCDYISDSETVYTVSASNEYPISYIDSFLSMPLSFVKKYGKVWNASELGILVSNNDNSVALKNAIRRISESGGGTIFIPDGVYSFSSEIELENGVNIVGAGTGKTVFLFNIPSDTGTAFSVANNTVLEGFSVRYLNLPSVLNADTDFSGAALYGNGNTNIIIENVEFINSGTGIRLNECSDIHITDVYGTSLDSGIRLVSCSGACITGVTFDERFADTVISAFHKERFVAVFVYEGKNISVFNCSCTGGDYALMADSETVDLVPESPSLTCCGIFGHKVYSPVVVGRFDNVAICNVLSDTVIFGTNAYHFTTLNNNYGKVLLCCLMGTGEVTSGVYIRSGTVDLQSCIMHTLGKTGIHVTGGDLLFTGSFLLDNNCDYVVEASSGTIYMMGNNVCPSTAFEGIDKKYIRKNISTAAVFQDDGNIKINDTLE